ncbi:MAG: hypothetical protein D6771_09315, partial [Zetaproteobacteria bacterium]
MTDFVVKAERYAVFLRRFDHLRAKTKEPTIRQRFFFSPKAAERNLPQLERLIHTIKHYPPLN